MHIQLKSSEKYFLNIIMWSQSRLAACIERKITVKQHQCVEFSLKAIILGALTYQKYLIFYKRFLLFSTMQMHMHARVCWSKYTTILHRCNGRKDEFVRKINCRIWKFSQFFKSVFKYSDITLWLGFCSL